MRQSLFICIGGLEFLRNIKDCVNAFLSLLNTQYEIVLGRKGVAVTLRITFDKKDCFHLMGLQYLIDRPELNRDREKIFDKILMGDINTNRVESSDFYERIKERMIIIIVGLFSQKRKKIILKIRHYGRCCIKRNVI